MAAVRFFRSFALSAACAVLLSACGGEGNQQVLDDAEREEQAVVTVKGFIQKNLDDLAASSAALAEKAPPPDADGWNATADKATVDALKAEWKKARLAYESVEGAIAIVFPDLDVSTDGRYDGFIATSADDDLFDDQGVTGVHAIERILWSDQTPAKVVEFEAGLPHYKAAAFPATQAEAAAFKDKLCKRLAEETRSMAEQFKGLALDAPAAYHASSARRASRSRRSRRPRRARKSPATRRSRSPTCARTSPPPGIRTTPSAPGCSRRRAARRSTRRSTRRSRS